MPRLTRVLPLLITALAAAAPATASAAATVSIVGKSFGPSAVTVAPGDAVTWTWSSGPHNVHVVSGPQSFDSGIKDTGGTYTHTLTAPGTYAYQCDVHPTMRGTVVVGAPAATPAPAGPAGAAPPTLRAVTVTKLGIVRLTSSTAGSLAIRVLRGARVAKRSKARLVQGVNRVPLAVKGLARGRYRVSLQATTASGQTSAPVVRTLLVTRAVLARHIVLMPAPAPAAIPAPAAAPAPAPAADDAGHGADHH